MNEIVAEPKGIAERSLSASFLLVHAGLLVALDLMFAAGSLGMGAIGLAAFRESGQDALLLFGFSAVSGTLAAAILLCIVVEAMVSVLAFRGRTGALLPVSLVSLVGSLLFLPLNFLTCSIFGLGLNLPMIVVAAIAVAFAGMTPREERARPMR